MWLLHWLPIGFIDFFVTITLTLGVLCAVAGYLLLRFVPFFNIYKMYFQLAAIVLLSVGLFWKGCLVTEADWRKQVEALTAKLKIAEEKAKEVNVIIQERIITKVKKVKVVEYRNKEVIKYREVEINKDCVVPEVAVNILNEAATNPNKVIEQVESTEAADSDVEVQPLELTDEVTQ